MPARNPWKLVAACLAAGCAYLWFAHRPAPAPDLVFSPVTSDAGVTASPAISPDGQLAVYASDRDAPNLELYLQPLPRGAALRLTHTGDNETEPAISPDSATIAFRSGAALFLMPARGGERRLLVPAGRDPRFSPDGKSLAYWQDDASFVIPSAGGPPRRVFAELKSVRHPAWSPDGALLIAQSAGDYVVAAPGAAPYSAGISLRSSDNAAWTPAGLYLIARTGWVRNIWRVPLDARGRQSAAPERITRAAESTGDLAVSRDGRLLFTSGTQRFNLWTIPLTGAAPSRLTEGPATTENPAISADGRRLLYDAEREGVQQLFLRDLDTGLERAVTAAPHGATAPRWLPDGRIVYRERTALWLLDLATGAPRKLAEGVIPWGASPQTLLVESPSGIDELNLTTLARTPLLRGPSLSNAWYSPDAREVLFTDGAHIRRASLPDLRITEVADGRTPRWSPDGRLIYFLRDSAIWSISSTGQPTLVWRSPTPRLSLDPVNPAAQSLALARDKLILLLAESTSNLWLADPR